LVRGAHFCGACGSHGGQRDRSVAREPPVARSAEGQLAAGSRAGIVSQLDRLVRNGQPPLLAAGGHAWIALRPSRAGEGGSEGTGARAAACSRGVPGKHARAAPGGTLGCMVFAPGLRRGGVREVTRVAGRGQRDCRRA